MLFNVLHQAKLTGHGRCLLSLHRELSACGRQLKQMGEPPAMTCRSDLLHRCSYMALLILVYLALAKFQPSQCMRCRWLGCREEVVESPEGLVDTVGALVELVEGQVEWLQPIDFFIHVSCHAYSKARTGCQWEECEVQASTASLGTAQLRGHMRVHAGEKTIGCPQCQGTFTSRKKVSIHINNKEYATTLFFSSFYCRII